MLIILFLLRIIVFVQIYMLWLDFKELGLLLLLFLISAIIIFFILLVMEGNCTFGNVSSRALLRSWLT